MRAGFGKYEITPPMGVELSGYGYYLGRRAQSVRDPLFARALMLECDGERVLVISCEVLGVSRFICEKVFEHAAQYGVSRDHVMIVSIHTHTGPSLKYHEGCGFVDDAFAATMPGMICRAVDAAYADMAEVSALTHMSAELPGDYIYNRTSPGGPVDRMVRGFTFTREGKKPVAAVSTACHCVCRRCIPDVSADYAGEINAMLESEGYECLFLNGACGDIDPFQPTPERTTEFAKLVHDVYLSQSKPLPLTLSAGQIPYTLKLVPLDEEGIRQTAAAAVVRNGGPDQPASRVALVWEQEKLAEADKLAYEEPIQVKYMVLGGVPVIALPFEAYTTTGQLIRQVLGRNDVLTLGTAEELLGYLPTREDIEHGSYASSDAFFLYKRLPPLPGEAERLGEEMGKALERILA
ncbi:MAG: neutral/alkaline non-lysosomal ceramidase N-terminal domain-containing protein [Clostridia bacterium]|nr:neutral/alkaline non-lysosomal ceramidase N-terminal domain-containing protein [Clostridia bacterium]